MSKENLNKDAVEASRLNELFGGGVEETRSVLPFKRTVEPDAKWRALIRPIVLEMHRQGFTSFSITKEKDSGQVFLNVK